MRLIKIEKPMPGHLYLCKTRHETIFLSECHETMKGKLSFNDRVYANVYLADELAEIYYVDRSNQMVRIPPKTRKLNDNELIESQDKFTDNYVDYLGVSHNMIGKPAGDYLCVVRPMESQKTSETITVEVNGKVVSSQKSDFHRLMLTQELFFVEKLGYSVYVNGVRRDRNWINDHYNVISKILLKKPNMTMDEFHTKRIMFFFYDNTMMVYGGKDPLTHSQWLSGIFGINTEELIEIYPRGYILNGVLAIYRGKDFKDDISLIEITAIGNMMKGYDSITRVHLGAIPGPDQPWKPKKCFTRADIIRMQNEADSR